MAPTYPEQSLTLFRVQGSMPVYQSFAVVLILEWGAKWDTRS